MVLREFHETHWRTRTTSRRRRSRRRKKRGKSLLRSNPRHRDRCNCSSSCKRHPEHLLKKVLPHSNHLGVPCCYILSWRESKESYWGWRRIRLWETLLWFAYLCTGDCDFLECDFWCIRVIVRPVQRKMGHPHRDFPRRVTVKSPPPPVRTLSNTPSSKRLLQCLVFYPL